MVSWQSVNKNSKMFSEKHRLRKTMTACSCGEIYDVYFWLLFCCCSVSKNLRLKIFSLCQKMTPYILKARRDYFCNLQVNENVVNKAVCLDSEVMRQNINSPNAYLENFWIVFYYIWNLEIIRFLLLIIIQAGSNSRLF